MQRTLDLGSGSVLDARGVSRSDPARVRAAFEASNADLLSRTRQAARAGARIVVWSEQAGNVLVSDKPAYLAKAASVAREEGIYLQVASSVYLPETSSYRNQTNMISPGGEVLWTYNKTNPIPGLEPLPPGDGAVPVTETPYGRLATVTCFDADFPALARVSADIMIIPGARLGEDRLGYTARRRTCGPSRMAIRSSARPNTVCRARSIPKVERSPCKITPRRKTPP